MIGWVQKSKVQVASHVTCHLTTISRADWLSDLQHASGLQSAGRYFRPCIFLFMCSDKVFLLNLDMRTCFPSTGGSRKMSVLFVDFNWQFNRIFYVNIKKLHVSFTDITIVTKKHSRHHVKLLAIRSADA